MRYGPVPTGVSGINGTDWLEKHNMNFAFGAWTMFNTARYDDELSLLDRDRPIPKEHVERARHYQEHLVFMLMRMPNEVTLKLDQLHMLTVELTDDLRNPVSIKKG